VHQPLGIGYARLQWRVFLIGLKVREGNALLYKYREVKRKQIRNLMLFIDPQDLKHSRSTHDLYSFVRPRNVQRFLPPYANHTASMKSESVSNRTTTPQTERVAQRLTVK
jgi:hypothetical protein